LLLGHGSPPPWTPPGGIYFDLTSLEGLDVYSETEIIS
jgi:hypothetical protein